MVPKHEIFDPCILTPFYAICWGYSVPKRILSIYLFFELLFNFFENIRRLSSRLDCLHIHWAFAYTMCAYAQYTHAQCMRMLNLRMHGACVRSAFAYHETHINHMDACECSAYACISIAPCLRMICMCVHGVSVCSAYPCQHHNTLSIPYTFLSTQSPTALGKCYISKNLFWTLLLGLYWSKNNDLFWP